MNNRLAGLLDFYKKDPDDPFVLYGLALEYVSENQPEKAGDFFQQLLKQNPDYVAGYMQYAWLKEKENNIVEARELYIRGIKAALKSGDKKSAKEMEEFLDELE
jgi:tetratricopeptide (TPR) repeat protein